MLSVFGGMQRGMKDQKQYYVGGDRVLKDEQEFIRRMRWEGYQGGGGWKGKVMSNKK